MNVKKNWISLILVILLLAAVIPFFPVALAQDSPVAVVGYIRYPTGTPVPDGITVVVYNTNNSQYANTTTGLGTGMYATTIMGDDYNIINLRVDVSGPSGYNSTVVNLANPTHWLNLTLSHFPPIADFTFTPSNPSIGELVLFYDRSTDEDGRIVSWRWGFGDGTTSPLQNPTNAYGEERYYTVSLRVTDDDGLTDTATKTLRVGEGEGYPYIPPPRDPKYSGFTVPEMYNLLRVSDLPDSGNAITVVFIDSGMRPRSYMGTDLSVIECLYHPDYVTGRDMNGHGTFVSYELGYILETKLSNARLISYRAFDRLGKSTSDIFLDSLDEVKNLKPDIVSISAGVMGSPGDVYSQKIRELRSSGIIVICAVGNLGPRASTIMSPACSDSAIGVGASDPRWADGYTERQRIILDLSDDTICSWSGRGPVEGVYPKPDVTSPGESIIGPWLDAERVWSGTSFSTPLIAGGSAVVLANNKGLANLVEMLYFWDSSIVPNAFEDALKDGCYAKGIANDWGKGIPVFTDVNNAFFWNLLILLLALIIIIVIIVILVVVYLLFFRKKVKKGKQKE